MGITELLYLFRCLVETDKTRCYLSLYIGENDNEKRLSIRRTAQSKRMSLIRVLYLARRETKN